jgi:hypothetical protein
MTFAGILAFDVGATFVTTAGAIGTIIGSAGLSFNSPLFEMCFGYEAGRFTMRDLDGDMEVCDYAENQPEILALCRPVDVQEEFSLE